MFSTNLKFEKALSHRIILKNVEVVPKSFIVDIIYGSSTYNSTTI